MLFKIGFPSVLMFIRNIMVLLHKWKNLSSFTSLNLLKGTLLPLLNHFAPKTELCASFRLTDHKHSFNSNFHLFDITAHTVHYSSEVLDQNCLMAAQQTVSSTKPCVTGLGKSLLLWHSFHSLYHRIQLWLCLLLHVRKHNQNTDTDFNM